MVIVYHRILASRTSKVFPAECSLLTLKGQKPRRAHSDERMSDGVSTDWQSKLLCSSLDPHWWPSTASWFPRACTLASPVGRRSLSPVGCTERHSFECWRVAIPALSSRSAPLLPNCLKSYAHELGNLGRTQSFVFLWDVHCFLAAWSKS